VSIQKGEAMKWLSRKLIVAIVTGIVLIVRPEIAPQITIVACVYLVVQGAVDIFKK
jgi:hypothetical protein